MAGEPWWASDGGDVTVWLGKCERVLPGLAACSADAILTDPPAGIGFMGSEWDDFRRARNPADAGRDNVFGRTSARGPEYGRAERDAFTSWLAGCLAEAGRVLKPGGHVLVWSIPRTAHWTAWAVEDAGLEIRDCILHVFGQGFPKGPDVLKPAQEMWWLARKPLAAGTVAANVLAWGTGALNVNDCRVGTTRAVPASLSRDKTPNGVYGAYGGGAVKELDPDVGRWPPNLVLSHSPDCQPTGTVQVRSSQAGPSAPTPDRRSAYNGTGAARPPRGYGLEAVESTAGCVSGCPVAELDAQSGTLTSGALNPGHKRGQGRHVHEGGYVGGGTIGKAYGNDTGGASRFFPVFRYQAKAATAERPRLEDGTQHETVKPLALIRWLARLITPPGGTILDLFAGSGPVGEAAVIEGFRAVLIDQDPKSARLIRNRLGKQIQAVLPGGWE